jgi:hypothetical protein
MTEATAAGDISGEESSSDDDGKIHQQVQNTKAK